MNSISELQCLANNRTGQIVQYLALPIVMIIKQKEASNSRNSYSEVLIREQVEVAFEF